MRSYSRFSLTAHGWASPVIIDIFKIHLPISCLSLQTYSLCRRTCRSWANGISRPRIHLSSSDCPTLEYMKKQLENADIVSCDTNMSLSQLDFLAVVLESKQCTVRHLRFKGHGGVGMPTKALGLGVAGSRTLRRLDVMYCGLDNGYYPHELFTGISKCATLSTVSLKGNKCRGFADSICRILQTSYNLTKVNLGRNNINDDGLKELATYLRKDKQLKSLSLRWNTIGSDGALMLSEALATNGTLTRLNLRKNLITSRGFQALVTVLGRNTSLAKLNMASNALFIESLGAGSLGSNCYLTKLNLGSTGLDPGAIRRLSVALAGNTRLQYLELSQNEVRTEGIIFLIDFIKYARSLRYLGFARNYIGNAGLCKLAHAVAFNGNIILLDLTHNDFGPKRSSWEWTFLGRISQITPHKLVDRRSRATRNREEYM
jgi:hypothetical protein